jgi:fibronectin-binding autotransporter adhesin
MTFTSTTIDSGLTLDASGTGAVNFSNTAAIVNSTNNQGRFHVLRGTNTGDNTLAALITNNGSGVVNMSKTGIGKWVLTNSSSSFTGSVFLSNGTLSVNLLANSGSNSPLGAGTTIALGRGGDSGTLQYTGSGHSTNRPIRIGTPNTVPGVGGGTILNDGTGALTFTNATFNTPVTGLTGAANSQNRTITLGGSYSGGVNVVSGVIANNTASTGLVGVTKSGPGTWRLDGANTYTGATTVSAGLLRVNGSLAAGSAVNVADGATLGGTGTVAGAIVLNGTISPGASTGQITTGAQTWNEGSTYKFEINDFNGTQGSTTAGWDHINSTGSLTFNAPNWNKFKVDVTSLTSGQVAGTADNFNSANPYTLVIATFAGGISGFDAANVQVITASFANSTPPNATWTVTQNVNNLELNYSPVPEPQTILAGVAVAGLAFGAARRRKNTHHMG